MERLTVTDLAAGVMLALVYGLLVLLAFSMSDPDFTDTGVGCVDDCLEIQDEADTVASKERN